jgi:hypothetical protein
MRTAAILACALLSGCYEPASTWDEHKGRYRPTDEVRRDEINREIDKRIYPPMADCKSGGGCCRPHLQDNGSWEIECREEDWRATDTRPDRGAE